MRPPFAVNQPYGLTAAEIFLIELSVHPFKSRCTRRLEKVLAVHMIDENVLPAVAAAHEKADFPVAPQDPERHSGGMKANLKPANSKARALLNKLLALAERGVDGEKTAAQRKIRRLKARFDFSAPDPAETPDLFSGSFRRSATARLIYSFGPNEFEVANSVKWAIESATKIQCVYRHRELLAEASSATARKLEEIALQIASNFRALLGKFSAVGGVSAEDRGVFVMGLYDGMMNETRNAGQPLPSRPGRAKRQRGRKRAAPRVAGVHVHPYTLAVGLGKQIRFSVPVEEIAAELEVAMRKCLAQEHADPPSPASKT